METNTIICGAMPEATKVFPDGYFNCSISSPPYWALRDYGTATWEGGNPDCSHEVGRFKYKVSDKQKSNTGSAGHQARDICPHCGAKRTDKQLGLEPTFEEYIDKLCTIYDEVKRVLRDDGTCWVNLGDTYGSGSRTTNCEDSLAKGKIRGTPVKNRPAIGYDKCLLLIPQRFAIEMVNRGWILRNVIIWHKSNPMPSSAKDRFTVDFEYVYFFVKSKKYWFSPQYEPVMESTLQRDKYTRILAQDGPQAIRHNHETPSNPLGRNKRTVWTIPTQPYPQAHFATFPEKLVEPMIKAGCPEFVCTKCGKAREKIYDTEYSGQSMSDTEKYANPAENTAPTFGRGIVKNYFKGYTDCGCNADFRPGIVIDIFAGSGTTLQVAARLRRDWIGIELKPEYIEMAEKRAQQGETSIPAKEQKAGQLALFKVKQ